MVELHRHNYDHHFNHKYEEPVSPEPKLQNYLPTRRKVREARPWWRRCCSLCLSNCEFVTVFVLCLAVFLVFLYLFANCELTNSYISSQLAELNNVSQVAKTSLKTGKADIHILIHIFSLLASYQLCSKKFRAVMVLFIFRFGEVIQVDLPETSRVPRPRPRRGPSLGPSCTSRCGSPLTPPAWPPSPTPWPTAPCSSSSSPSSEQVDICSFK